MSFYILVNKFNDKFNIPLEEKRLFITYNEQPMKMIKVFCINNDIAMLALNKGSNNHYFPDLIWKEIENERFYVIDGYITNPDFFMNFLDNWSIKKSNALLKINGSFTIFVYDKKVNALSVITDRFNSRPVYYCLNSDRYIISNYPLSLTYFSNKLSYNPGGLWSFLMLSRPVGTLTAFDDIASIPPGTIATFQNSRITKVKWFDLKYVPNYKWSKKRFAEAIANGLKQSAERIKERCNNCTLFLSGGMDSRIAAAAMGQINTITLITNPNFSSRIAANVAERINANHRSIVRDNNWYLDYFDLNSFFSGGLYNFAHAHFTKYLIEIMDKKSSTSFLLGDLLENFNKNYFKLDICKYSFIPEQVPDLFYGAFGYSTKNLAIFRKIFTDEGYKFEEAWREELISVAREVNQVSDDPADKWNALFRWYNNIWCPTNFMLESIKPFAELRNLMFDNDVFDLLLSMPAKFHDRQMHSLILRNLNPELISVPDSNYLLPPFFPEILMQYVQKVRPQIGRLMRIAKPMNLYRTHGSWHMLNYRYRNDPHHRKFIDQAFSSDYLAGIPFSRHRIKEISSLFLNNDDNYYFEINMMLSLSCMLKILNK